MQNVYFYNSSGSCEYRTVNLNIGDCDFIGRLFFEDPEYYDEYRTILTFTLIDGVATENIRIFYRYYNIFTSDANVGWEDWVYSNIDIFAGQTGITTTVICRSDAYYDFGSGGYGFENNDVVAYELLEQSTIPEVCLTGNPFCNLTIIDYSVINPENFDESTGSITILISGATGTSVTYRINGIIKTITGSNSGYTFTGLTSGTYDVLVEDGDCFAQETNIVVQQGQPFTLVSIKNTGAQNIVRWEIADSYGVQYRQGISGNWNSYNIKTEPLTGNTFITDISGLTPNQLYQYRAIMSVRNIDYLGNVLEITPTSPSEDTIPIIITGNGIDITTSGFTIQNNLMFNNGNLSITKYGVIWTQDENVGFNINYNNYIGIDETISNIPNNTLFNKFATNLSANTFTWFRAYAQNSLGIGYGLAKRTTMLPVIIPFDVPTVITGSIVDRTTTGFTVQNNLMYYDGGLSIQKYGIIWTDDAGVGYGLNYSNYSGIDETLGSIANNTQFTKYVIGSTEDTLIWFCAYAENFSGMSYGTVLTGKTLPPPPPLTPTGLDVSEFEELVEGVYRTYLYAEWNPVATATSYTTRYRVNEGLWSPKNFPSPSTNWTSGIYFNSLEYVEVQVLASNVGGDSAWSSSVGVTIGGGGAL